MNDQRERGKRGEKRGPGGIGHLFRGARNRSIRQQVISGSGRAVEHAERRSKGDEPPGGQAMFIRSHTRSKGIKRNAYSATGDQEKAEQGRVGKGKHFDRGGGNFRGRLPESGKREAVNRHLKGQSKRKKIEICY